MQFWAFAGDWPVRPTAPTSIAGGLTHAVFTQPARLAAADWPEASHNKDNRVLANASPAASPEPAP